jgi:hypothetical protein
MNGLIFGDRVVIVKDCRAGIPPVDGQVAVYEGPHTVIGSLQSPQFTLPDGTTIYGYECWWRPVEESD